MNFLKIIRRHWGKPEFKDALSQFLSANQDEFNIEDYCSEGGWLSEVEEISVQSFSDDTESIVVEGGVDFTESVPTGCPDLPNDEPRHLSFTLTIDKNTGEGELDIDAEADSEFGEYY